MRPPFRRLPGCSARAPFGDTAALALAGGPSWNKPRTPIVGPRRPRALRVLRLGICDGAPRKPRSPSASAPPDLTVDGGGRGSGPRFARVGDRGSGPSPAHTLPSSSCRHWRLVPVPDSHRVVRAPGALCSIQVGTRRWQQGETSAGVERLAPSSTAPARTVQPWTR